MRPLLQLRCHRPVHRLSDFREAFLETGKRSRRKVAVIFNRVPAVFDTAHVGLVFTDVMRYGHCGARISLPFDETQGSVSDARMPGRSWAPAREPNSLFEASLCRPTAPGLPIWGTGHFGTSRIFGQLSDKPLLASNQISGVWERKAQWRIEILIPTKKRFLWCWRRRPLVRPEVAAEIDGSQHH